MARTDSRLWAALFASLSDSGSVYLGGVTIQAVATIPAPVIAGSVHTTVTPATVNAVAYLNEPSLQQDQDAVAQHHPVHPYRFWTAAFVFPPETTETPVSNWVSTSWDVDGYVSDSAVFSWTVEGIPAPDTTTTISWDVEGVLYTQLDASWLVALTRVEDELYQQWNVQQTSIPPVNDTLTNAITLDTASGSLVFDTTGAGTSLSDYQGGSDVWYTFVAVADTDFWVEVSSHAFLPHVQIYASDGETLLAEPDYQDISEDSSEPDEYYEPGSAVELLCPVTQNEQYFIRIVSHPLTSGAQGEGEMEWAHEFDPESIDPSSINTATIDTYATLSVARYFDRPPVGMTIQPMETVSYGGWEPYLIFRGKPIQPMTAFLAETTMRGIGDLRPWNSDDFEPPHTVVFPPPTTTSHSNAKTWIWQANRRYTASNGWVTAWQEKSGAGPTWRSARPRRPKTVIRTSDRGTKLRAMNFNWDWVEHMWIDLGSVKNPPYTWIVTGIFFGGTNKQHHHVLDTGGANGKDGTAIGRCFIHHRPERTALYAGSTVGGTTSIRNGNPVVIAGVVNGGASWIYHRGKNYERHYKGASGNSSIRRMVLGRQHGHMSKYYASRMSVFEVRFIHAGYSLAQLHSVSQQLASTYKFGEF